tara:strand:- start:3360 stop:3563 length:204 start_codon:yes stop_codon:yes gene_type:complete
MANEYIRVAMEISRSKTPNTSKMIKSFALGVSALEKEISDLKSKVSELEKKKAAPKKAAPKKTTTKK